MLYIDIPKTELFDEKTSSFINITPTTLQLEHSLLSLSKWEAKWCKPFLGNTTKTVDEIIDYVRCMTINGNVNPDVYRALTGTNLETIQNYIDSPMTATTISNRSGKASNEIVTSELIYYWMISNGIPFECQKWHLNRLLMLIRVCVLKTTPQKKMSQAELIDRNTQLNKLRRAQLGSRG